MHCTYFWYPINADGHLFFSLVFYHLYKYHLFDKKHIQNLRNCDRNMSNCVVSTVPTDGLPPLGARTSAGTVMATFGTCTSTVSITRMNNLGMAFWIPQGVLLSANLFTASGSNIHLMLLDISLCYYILRINGWQRSTFVFLSNSLFIRIEMILF